MLSLRDVQSRFFASIARMPGAGALGFDAALVECVENRGALDAKERLDIYAQMYFARLVEVLENDFPRVAALLGCERFHAVARAYLAQHPSTHPSLRHLGRAFPDFLRDCSEVAELPFLGDLAALEWARIEVFDAPDAYPLRVEQLQEIAPDDWPMLKLPVIPALIITHSEWPVHDIWRVVEAETLRVEEIQPEPTVLRVWRKEFAVYHTKMDSVELTALSRIRENEPFAVVCNALESLLPAEEAAAAIGGLLLRWIDDGILAYPPEK